MGEQVDMAQLQMDLTAEAMGGGAHFVMTITNAGGEPVEVIFASGQSYDFEVRQGGATLWRWSEDRMFTQAMREERLAPGERWTFEEMWQAPAGASGGFEVVGSLTSANRPLEQVAQFRLP
jgi:hypothetical protein